MNSDKTSFLNLPLKRIATWAFILNALWEFAQCTVLYDMWSWGLWRGGLWMWGAVVGDVVIVLTITFISSMFARHLNPPDKNGWLVLGGTSLIASIALEWLAIYFELWSYSAWMPTTNILGFSVGLAPIAQITLLPSLSVFLAHKLSQPTPTSQKAGQQER